MKKAHEDTMMHSHPDQSLAKGMSFKKQHLWIDRKDKRLSINLSCTVSSMDGRSCSAEVLNLSAGGMKFACNRNTFEQLLPEGLRTPGMISEVAMKVRFALEDAAGDIPAQFDTTALIIHSERLAQDSYHVGVQFTGLNDNDSKRLAAFIESALAAGKPSD